MTDTRALAHLVCCDANLALCGIALPGGDEYTEDELPTCPLCALIDEMQRPCGDPGCDVGGDDPDADLESDLAEAPSWMRVHPRHPVEPLRLDARPAACRPASASRVKRHPPPRGADHRRTRPGRRRET